MGIKQDEMLNQVQHDISKFMKKRLIISLIVVVAVCFLAGSAAQAAGKFIPCGGAEGPDCTLCHFLLMIKNIMDFLVNTSFVVVSLMAGIGGIMYMTSGGDTKKAKATITSALWGFVIVMSAWLIINSMLVAMGVNEANIGLKSVGSQFIIDCNIE